jgi:hypothetical protein
MNTIVETNPHRNTRFDFPVPASSSFQKNSRHLLCTAKVTCPVETRIFHALTDNDKGFFSAIHGNPKGLLSLCKTPAQQKRPFRV